MGIFAHPDDESLLAAGAFAMAHSEKNPSYLVVASQGELGGRYKGVYGRRLAETRAAELVHVAKILHVTKLFPLSYPDKGVERMRTKLADNLEKYIRRYSPEIIITHDPFDTSQHPDHIATALACLDAIEKSPISPSCTVLFAVYKPSEERVTYALDIDAYREIKIQACRTHLSQGLFRQATSTVPVDVYYAVNHFEYFIPYEKDATTNHKRHYSDKK